MKSSRVGYVSLLLLPIIPLGGVMIFALFLLGGVIWLLGKLGVVLGEDARQGAFIVSLVIGFVVGVVVAWSLFQFLRSGNQLEKRDLASGIVEVISVSQPVVIQQEEHNDEGPIYYFDIGDGKILVVCGQWIYEEQTYGTCIGDRTERNGAEDDWPPFPSENFTIHRAPSSGKVLRIDVRGTKLEPAQVIKAKSVRITDGSDSMVLEGSLNDLNSAMSRTRRGRRSRKGKA